MRPPRANLKVSQLGEKYEEETNLVADRIIGMAYYDPSNPNRIDPNILNIGDLIQASSEPFGKGGLTKAGRALDKHATGQRGSSPFPPLTGNNTNKNLIAEQQVNELLNHPDVVFVRLGRGGIEARVPDGRGIRFEADGSFGTFVD